MQHVQDDNEATTPLTAHTATNAAELGSQAGAAIIFQVMIVAEIVVHLISHEGHFFIPFFTKYQNNLLLL